MALVLAETVEVTQSGQSVEFTNIPQIGHSLIVWYSAKPVSDSDFNISVNNNTTTSDSFFTSSGSGSTGFVTQYNTNRTPSPGSSISDQTRVVGYTQIGNYAIAGEKKPYTSEGGWVDSVDNNAVFNSGGEYAETAAITSLKLETTFEPETLVSLYILTEGS